jgi:hypothetical protein
MGKFAVVFFLSSLVVACGHEYVEAATTTTTAATTPSPVNAHAIDTLTAARCMHEASCDTVGGGKTYLNYDTCLGQLRATTTTELAAGSCTQTVDDNRLDACLAEIRADSCSAPLDALARLTSCTALTLCAPPDQAPATAGAKPTDETKPSEAAATASPQTDHSPQEAAGGPSAPAASPSTSSALEAH